MGFFGYFLKPASLLSSSCIYEVFPISMWMGETRGNFNYNKMFGVLVRYLHMTHADKRKRAQSLSSIALEKKHILFVP